ncbi:calmodulin-binding transcription activator CBT-like [Phragmites australis]|uniref:calmodulin-binding transcription activator CBT-like n=1 Tax=Phragmites australis TaxID=29695 RepID=UPI002D7A34BE|nr:calmodulin-binding transcription activator CBT-like [Phragmites australis]
MASGAGGRDLLVASEIHGFLTCADLNFEKLMVEAATRWFRPNEIYAVLANHARLKVRAQPIDKPVSGTVILYDRKVVRNFRKDGHNWKKKKDGKTVQEAHEKLKIGNEEKVHVYYARGDDDPNFFRRCYWLLDKELERIVLVHYRQTSEENAIPPPNTGTEVAQVAPINMIHFTSPLTSTDLAPARTEQSCDSAAPEEINSHGGGAISSETDDHDSRLELFWADLLESSMKNDASVSGESLASNQLAKYEMRDSGNNIWNTNATSNVIFSPPANVISEAYATNPGHNQVSESYFGALKHQADQSPSLLTSDLDSQSKHLASSLLKTPVDGGNIPNDVPPRQNSLGLWKYLNDDIPCLGDNPSSAILTTQPVTNERLFHITEISPEWAYCTEDTKVLVVGYFHARYRHLTETSLHCVIGDKCVAADIVQSGVYRFMARPHTPGQVNLYLTLDGKIPISEVLSFDYRIMPSSSSNTELSSVEDEPKRSKLQMQMRLARLLFSTNKKKIPPKLLVEGSKVSNLLSALAEKEWMDLFKFITDSKGPYVPATEGLLELMLRNRLQEWLIENVIEGHKATGRDDLGQGPIHLCSFLGYTWAIRLFSLSGFSLDFRDSSGWTALHWAAYYGREKMVAALLSAGANPSLVTDPTHEDPGGYTAADLAARQGYDGLAAYLAEKGLTAHFEAMSLSKDTGRSPRTQSTKLQTKEFETLSEQELCLRESLAAYRNAADAASNIQAALRERTLKLQTKAIQLANPETEAAAIVAAMRIQHAFRNHNRKKMMRAAVRIQSHFRTWKIRRDFMNIRRQAIKIQAAYRGHQVRRQYRKVIWSVGVVEKAILRWRKKRKGLRGIATGMPVAMATDAEPESTAEEDYYQVGRQQAEDRFNRSVVRVQALFRSYQAQQEYRRMKVAHEEAKVEFSGN